MNQNHHHDDQFQNYRNSFENQAVPDHHISQQNLNRSNPSQNYSVPVDLSKGVFDPITNSVIIPINNGSNQQNSNPFTDISPVVLPPPPPVEVVKDSNEISNSLMFDFANMDGKGFAVHTDLHNLNLSSDSSFSQKKSHRKKSKSTRKRVSKNSGSDGSSEDKKVEHKKTPNSSNNGPVLKPTLTNSKNVKGTKHELICIDLDKSTDTSDPKTDGVEEGKIPFSREDNKSPPLKKVKIGGTDNSNFQKEASTETNVTKSHDVTETLNTQSASKSSKDTIKETKNDSCIVDSSIKSKEPEMDLNSSATIGNRKQGNNNFVNCNSISKEPRIVSSNAASSGEGEKGNSNSVVLIDKSKEAGVDLSNAASSGVGKQGSTKSVHGISKSTEAGVDSSNAASSGDGRQESTKSIDSISKSKDGVDSSNAAINGDEKQGNTQSVDHTTKSKEGGVDSQKPSSSEDVEQGDTHSTGEASIIEECKVDVPSPKICVSPDVTQDDLKKSEDKSTAKQKKKKGNHTSKQSTTRKKKTEKKKSPDTSKSTKAKTKTSEPSKEDSTGSEYAGWGNSGWGNLKSNWGNISKVKVKDGLAFFNEGAHPTSVSGLLDLMIDTYYSKFKRDTVEYEDDGSRSLSVIQPMEETGSMLDIYPGTHMCERNSFVLHKYMCLRLIIPYSCCIIFLSDLIHNGTNSRTKTNCKTKQLQDPRFFYYAHGEPTDGSDATKGRKSARRYISVSADPTLNPKVTNVCKLLENGSKCSSCLEHNCFGNKIIDMTSGEWSEFINLLSPTDVVIGDLSKHGFIVVKSYQCTSDVKHVFGNRTCFGSSTFSYLNGEPNRKLLFHPSRDDIVKQGRTYADCPIHKHIRVVHEQVVRLCIGIRFRLVKPNVIFNNGRIDQDQFPHWDFPERKIKHHAKNVAKK